MKTIGELYVNALLADATYPDGIVDSLAGDMLAAVISNRMTPLLAKFVASNFSVVSHMETNDFVSSGFDATVWRGNEGTPYAGKVYVSMQGTKGLSDFLADADLSTSGAARTRGQVLHSIIFDETENDAIQNLARGPMTPKAAQKAGLARRQAA